MTSLPSPVFPEQTQNIFHLRGRTAGTIKVSSFSANLSSASRAADKTAPLLGLNQFQETFADLETDWNLVLLVNLSLVLGGHR